MSFKKRINTLYTDFKKFISKGNIIDLAVGVIMGTSFNAIVTSLVNILLSLCTWGIPGGLSGLVTVLPALSDSQNSPVASNILTATEYVTYDEAIREQYIQYGQNYYYKGLAVIDWGTFINAIISFLIIALTLFVIVKVTAYLHKKREETTKKIISDLHKNKENTEVLEEQKSTEN